MHETAPNALRDRLKTTCAGRPKVDLAKVVIDEVTVVGSRCGPFKPALEALAQTKIDVRSLIIEVFPLKKGRKSFTQHKPSDMVRHSVATHRYP